MNEDAIPDSEEEDSDYAPGDFVSVLCFACHRIYTYGCHLCLY